MNRHHSSSLFFLALITLVQVGCKKSDAPSPTNSDYITQSAWKFDKATAGVTDISTQIPVCFKDNTITFASNGSGSISEGTTACVPPAPASFTWSFQNNAAQISLSTPLISGGSGIFNLVTLNSVSLVISQDMIIPPSTTAIPVVLAFKH